MKKPFIHALAALLYIVIIVLVISALESPGAEDTVFIPMTMLSLFVLSAAVMGYLFLVPPLELYIEHRKKEAITFFLTTLGFFAGFVVLFVTMFLIKR